VVAGALIGFGALLYVADKLGLTVRRIEHLSFGSAFAIGIFQCLAIIPGASRVGLAMTLGRLMGFERPDAVRFAFLLSIPVIFITGLYKGWLLFSAGEAAALQSAGLMIALVAIAAFLAIAFLMYWVRRANFTPFVAYRLALGLFVLYLFYVAGGPAC
jgi:undecaprenyl-diphosphatase